MKIKDTSGTKHKLRKIGEFWVSKTAVFDKDLTLLEPQGVALKLVLPPIYKVKNSPADLSPYVQRRTGHYVYPGAVSHQPGTIVRPYTLTDLATLRDHSPRLNQRHNDWLALVEAILRGKA